MKVDCWLVRMECRPPGLSVCPTLVILLSTIKSRRSFLLAPAHPGGPGKRAIKRLCVWYVSNAFYEREVIQKLCA